ncbi:o-succinylbenzoate synthase [candidate division KSB1 bacterium]|nr:MAG: o-succinylbenzoate synthase [candidate division KSB1 bacterium]
MKIVQVEYLPYDLAFRKPLDTPRLSQQSIEGFLILFKTDDGKMSISECPGASYRATNELKRLVKRRIFPPIPSCVDDLGPTIYDTSWYGFDEPTIQFAIDSALMSLVAQYEDKPLDMLLNPNSQKQIEVNALLEGTTHEELIDSAKEASMKHFRSMKVKIGRDFVSRDADLIYALRTDFPEMKLRADVNCLWTSSQFVHFCSFNQQREIEYIEDPIKTPLRKMPRGLKTAFGVPIALDESARDLNYSDSLFDRQVCDVLIIKPAYVGSYRKVRDICVKANDRGIDVVFTSAFESSLGLSYVAACAAAFGCPLRAHGLATAEFLAEDTLVESLLPLNGRINVPDVRDLPLMIKPDFLQPLRI